MELLRTPDERFAALRDYPFSPHYVDVDGVRVHHVDEGDAAAAPILLMHGEPSWSFLYRKMIPALVAAGHRVIAPDLVGFGRSDKPAQAGDYTYARHVAWMAALLERLDLKDITLFCQDWGGLIGLRLVAEHGERFARVIAANTGLPTGDRKMPDAFLEWQRTAKELPVFPVSRIVAGGCQRELSDAEADAYDAPFPTEAYKAGARVFPSLVPTRPDDPASDDNRRAWKALEAWDKPFLTAFSDGDPITAGGHRVFHKLVPGARGQEHVTIESAGHFLQEDAPDALVGVIDGFIARTR